MVLAGDETALPAIGRILEELPSDARGVAIVEVADAREEQDLPHPPGVALRWLHRNGLPAGTPNLLPAALRALHWPESGTAAAWAAAEFQVAQSMRCHLRDERGLDKDRCYCAAYWRQERG
ncbi:Vibriobactin utilization protein ViuB [Roseomonas sp. TAS13]|nr:Vibriobactin utilization protein ViuB [Roseomonas sp. TAS13]